MKEAVLSPHTEYGGGVVGREEKHSGMGIASLVLAILVGILAFLIIAVAGVLETTMPGGLDEDAPLTALIGLAIICCPLANLVGLGLGIGGLMQRRRKKLTAILGAIGNGLVFSGVLAIIVLGLTL